MSSRFSAGGQRATSVCGRPKQDRGSHSDAVAPHKTRPHEPIQPGRANNRPRPTARNSRGSKEPHKPRRAVKRGEVDFGDSGTTLQVDAKDPNGYWDAKRNFTSHFLPTHPALLPEDNQVQVSEDLVHPALTTIPMVTATRQTKSNRPIERSRTTREQRRPPKPLENVVPFNSGSDQGICMEHDTRSYSFKFLLDGRSLEGRNARHPHGRYGRKDVISHELAIIQSAVDKKMHQEELRYKHRLLKRLFKQETFWDKARRFKKLFK